MFQDHVRQHGRDYSSEECHISTSFVNPNEKGVIYELEWQSDKQRDATIALKI